MHPSRYKNTVWKYVGAGAMVVVGIAGFITSLFAATNNPLSTGMIVVPFVAGINMILAAINEDKSPRELMVGPYGIRATSKKEVQTYPWTDLGWAMIARNSWTSRKEYNIYNKQGKILLKVEDTLQNFDYLVQIVNHNIALQGDSSADAIRSGKAKRTGAGLIAGGCLFLLLSAANVWFAYQDQYKATQLKTLGVRGKAVIVRRYIAPNGVTHRITYHITAKNGTVGTHDAHVTEFYWDMLQYVKTAPVVYVPSDPNNSRLLYNEIRDGNSDPYVMYVIAIFISVMSIVFIVAGIMACRGLDIRFNRKTYQFKVKRYGDV
jgi:hypothetical protein